jgi:class 3 adenylate cyclase
MPDPLAKSLSAPDEVRQFPYGRVEIFNIGGVMMGRTIFQPGWHWAEHVKPLTGTASCQAHHVGIAMSGTLGVRMDDGTEYVIPSGTAYDVPSGHDGWVIGDEEWITVDFMGMRAYGQPSEDEQVLVSILFTDIVGSTAIASRMGDVAWKQLLARHDQEARVVLERYKAKQFESTGDGFMAIFDGAGRAVNCAAALGRVAESVGLQIRAGVHTGEVQLLDKEVRGVAVHEAARVMALAGANDVFVSATTHALLGASSSLQFESRGSHDLKGIDGPRDIWALLR